MAKGAGTNTTRKKCDVDEFRRALEHTISSANAPYCVFYVFMEEDQQDKNTQWENSITAAMATVSNEICCLAANGPEHLAAVIAPCSIAEATLIARLMRNRLLHDYPKARPKIVAAQTSTNNVDLAKLLTSLSAELDDKIKDNSSQIHVKRH